MEQQMNQSAPQKSFKNQPVLCPWISVQPLPSVPSNKARNCGQTNTTLPNHPINNWSTLQITMDTSKIYENSQGAPLQQSSSQFFYFLRLMELFPDTHPATLHTVLTLCKNNFFCAVDKLLYAKRCKLLYNRRQNIFQRMAQNRSHPYCNASNKSNGNTVFRGNNSQKPISVQTLNVQQTYSTAAVKTKTQLEAEPGIEKEEKISKGCNTPETKEEVEMSSPRDIQKFKIPIDPLSPQVEDAEDLSATILPSEENKPQE